QQALFILPQSCSAAGAGRERAKQPRMLNCLGGAKLPRHREDREELAGSPGEAKHRDVQAPRTLGVYSGDDEAAAANRHLRRGPGRDIAVMLGPKPVVEDAPALSGDGYRSASSTEDFCRRLEIGTSAFFQDEDASGLARPGKKK